MHWLISAQVQTNKFATFESGSAFLVGYTSAEHDATVVSLCGNQAVRRVPITLPGRRRFDDSARTRCKILISTQVVAWKEKVRHDLVRPTTFIQRTKEGDDILTWGGPYAGTQQIRGKDFQPYKRVMPCA